MPQGLSDRLRAMNGREHPLTAVSSALREHVSSLSPSTVGAHQICCSDESEKENVATFHQQFVRHLLPQLKNFSRSAFRTITLGGRYEPGALAIAEDHYAAPASQDHFKVLVVKINSHVGAGDVDAGGIYGHMKRYGRTSLSCGALHAMLENVDLPATRELAAAFGPDRLAALRELAQTSPHDVALRMAVASAGLQSRLVLKEVEARQALTPTVYIVASCVTFNHEQADTELLVGLANYDSREAGPASTVALGTDPRAYRFHREGRMLLVDEQ